MLINDASRKWWVLSGLSIACLIGLLDFSIVNTALPDIQKDLAMSYVALQWVMNMFVLGLCIFMVNMGRLGDVFGRRLLFYIGMGIFGISTSLAGLAEGGVPLIAFRGCQAFGLAMIIPSSIGIITQMFPKDQQGRALGYYTSITGVGIALGPILGGVITSAIGWRWVFFVNIPVLCIAAVICLFSLKGFQELKNDASVDWVGFLLMIVGLGSLVTAIVQGPAWGWGSLPSVVLFLVGACALTALFLVERKVKQPVINLEIFKNKGFVSGSLSNFAVSAVGYSSFFLMPLFLGNMLRDRPFMVGLMLLPITALIVILAPIVGKFVDKYGAKLPILAGHASMAIFSIFQMFASAGDAVGFIIFGFVFLGVGWGLVYGSAAFAAISALPDEQAASASGTLWTIQNLGGALGLAISGLIFRTAEHATVNTGLADAGVQLSRHDRVLVRSLLSDPSEARAVIDHGGGALGREVLPLFREGFMRGYHEAFIFMLCVSVFVFIVVARVMKNEKGKKVNAAVI